MNYIDFPLEKEYIREIRNQKWKLLHTIKYKQASLLEYMEFLALSEDQKWELCIEIILNWIEDSFYDKIYRFFKKDHLGFKKHKIIDIIYSNNIIKDLVDSIINTKFKHYKSIYDWVITEKQESRPSLYASNIQAICKQFWINGPNELFNKYTLEQYQWLVDWSIFTNNEMDEKKKKINDRAINKRDWWEVTTDDIKKALGKT